MKEEGKLILQFSRLRPSGTDADEVEQTEEGGGDPPHVLCMIFLTSTVELRATTVGTKCFIFIEVSNSSWCRNKPKVDPQTVCVR